MLFATLDTTTRSLLLPNGQKVLLSDTVGFISGLPTLLIDAFSSTLDEALNANAIIIVADASHPDALGCLNVTKETLARLNAIDKVKLLIINKTDDIYDDISYSMLKNENIKTIETSFKDGTGVQKVIKALTEITDEEFRNVKLKVDISNSSIVSELSSHGWLKGIEYLDSCILISARIPKTRLMQYSKYIDT